MGILKNAEIKINLQKKREQDDATQMKKKNIALKKKYKMSLQVKKVQMKMMILFMSSKRPTR